MTALPVMLMSDDEVANLGRDPSHGFGALITPRGALPLAALDVDARIAGVVAHVEVAQTFVNTTSAAMEATYVFPLPDRAAVNAFRMTVGARVIDGAIEERGRAREQYDEAIAAGKRAAIAEEDRPGVFSLRVGNLMPGEVAHVRLSLVGQLPIDDGEVTFQFPLVVAPRYIPGVALGGEQAGLGTASDTDLVPDASRISPPVLLAGYPSPVRLGLRVAFQGAAPREVASSLHAITQRKQDAHLVEVTPGERLDRDFVLRWRVDAAELRSAALVVPDGPDPHAGGTYAVTLYPPSTRAMASKPRDVVFVIDRSGSMGGWKMVAARRAAARMIDSLTSRDRFCAIAFDDQIERVPAAGLTDATDRARFRAVEALAKIDARGGTELAVPLQDAVRMLVGGTLDRERVIVLVTDGQVGNEDHILRELAPSLRNIKMFTLGIDQAVNAAFLRRLAAAGGGLCELVESEERLDDVMAKVHRRIGAPIATELALKIDGIEAERSMQSPNKLTDLYAGAPVVVLGRYRGGVSAQRPPVFQLTGTTLGEPLNMAIAGEVVAGESWLRATWARAQIRELEDRFAVSASEDREQEIVRISKQYCVLSRFTAFIAIDHGEVVNPGGRLYQAVQPVEEPAGWNSGPRMIMAQAMPMSMSVAPMGMAPPASAKTLVAGITPTGGIRRGGMPGGPPAGGAMPPPPAAPRARSMGMPSLRKESAKREEGGAATVDDSAYRASLAQLGQQLELEARGRCEAAAIRMLRLRLVQWVEDVRTAGLSDLAREVELLVVRLTSALGTSSTLAAEAAAVAAALAALGRNDPQPPAKKKSRLAFWK